MTLWTRLTIIRISSQLLSLEKLKLRIYVIGAFLTLLFLFYDRAILPLISERNSPIG